MGSGKGEDSSVERDDIGAATQSGEVLPPDRGSLTSFLHPTLFWSLLICICTVYSPSLSSFSPPPGRHFRSLLQSALCAIL